MFVGFGSIIASILRLEPEVLRDLVFCKNAPSPVEQMSQSLGALEP